MLVAARLAGHVFGKYLILLIYIMIKLLIYIKNIFIL